MSFAASVLAGPAGSSCVLMIMFTAESFYWSSGRKVHLQETLGCVIYPSVNIWLLYSVGTGTTVIQSCVKWLCRRFGVYWLWWKRDTWVHVLIFASFTVRCCWRRSFARVLEDQTETLLCFCRVLQRSLGSSDPSRNQARLQGRGPRRRPGRTTDRHGRKAV